MDYNFLHNPFYLIQREVCFASIVCLGFSFHGCAREIAVESFPGYETLCEKTHRCTDRCGVLRTSNETISTRCSQISIHIRERETETERERERETLPKYINYFPTRFNPKQSIYYSASSLYMFRVPNTPIIRSTQNCKYSLWYWSYFVQLLPSNVAKLAVV